MGKNRIRAAARAAFTAFLLILSAFCAAAPSPGPRAAPSVEDREAAIRALGPRREGAPGEAAAFDYVEAALREAGLSPAASDFSDASDDFSRSRIVEALLRGERDDELAIVVPLGSWADSPDASADGAYGIALALAEASRLAAESKEGKVCPITLRFVFLGAEKRESFAAGGIAALGSKTWIARQEGRGRLAVLYLNAPSLPSRVELRSAGKGVLAPYWYYEGARRALDASGMAFGIEANRQQAYRLGLASDFGPAAPYLEAGIPGVELRGDAAAGLRGEGAAGGGGGSLEGGSWFSAFVQAFAKEEAGGFPEAWDRHYFIIQLGRLVAVLREKTYVAILVGLVALVASSFLVATVARRSAMKQILKRAPAMGAELLALFGALALVFFACKGLALLEAAAFGSIDAWRLAPRIFAAARVLFALLLFLSLLSFLVEKRILTPNPYFYEFAGLVCLALDVLIFSAVDLSASFYFIWALVLVEASLALRRRWATLVAYAFMYLPLLIVAGELARRPDLASYGKLIAPGILGVFALSALSLPFFVFTASPLLFFAPPGTAARKRAVAFFATLAFAVEGLAFAYFWIAAPGSGPGRRDLSVSELIDQDRGRFDIELSGMRRLGRGSIARGGTLLAYRELGDKVDLSGRDAERRVEIGEEASPFLDRVDENIRVDFSVPPYSLEIALRSADEIFLYDCSLPYKVAVDGKRATIYAGVNPGADFSFSITVPASFRSELVVRARYLGPLEPCTQSSGSPLGYSGLTVVASRAIGGAGGAGGPGR
jgi:hypothetical protein